MIFSGKSHVISRREWHYMPSKRPPAIEPLCWNRLFQIFAVEFRELGNGLFHIFRYKVGLDMRGSGNFEEFLVGGPRCFLKGFFGHVQRVGLSPAIRSRGTLIRLMLPVASQLIKSMRLLVV